jgi:hypothetical protein
MDKSNGKVLTKAAAAQQSWREMLLLNDISPLRLPIHGGSRSKDFEVPRKACQNVLELLHHFVPGFSLAAAVLRQILGKALPLCAPTAHNLTHILHNL